MPSTLVSRRDAQSRARRLPAGPGHTIHQRVADVFAPEAEIAEEALLEWQHHRQTIDRRREPPGPTGMPGPELRGNVVEHLGPCLASRLGHAKMKARVIDQNHEVVAAGAEIVAERVQQTEMRAQLGDHFHQAECGQSLDGISDDRRRPRPFGGRRAPRSSRRDGAREARGRLPRREDPQKARRRKRRCEGRDARSSDRSGGERRRPDRVGHPQARAPGRPAPPRRERPRLARLGPRARSSAARDQARRLRAPRARCAPLHPTAPRRYPAATRAGLA